MDDGGKKWFVQRCTSDANDNSIINGIMLRFRPIAPKPTVDESFSGVLLTDNKNPIIPKKRTKRKYVRVKKNIQRRRKNKTSEDKVEKTVITLQLLPEKPDGMEPPERRSRSDHNHDTINIQDSTTWLNFVKPVTNDKAGGFHWIGSDLKVVVPRVIVMESWVTVECVTETCIEGGGLGSTDVEIRKNLEVDTCPSFISNGYNKVVWVNEAYKRMITRQGGEGQTTTEEQEDHDQEEEEEIMVWLVIKEKLPYFLYPAFTCRVRLQYTCGKEKGCSLILPCDTWRMDSGGFAWKLDVKAALSLGRRSSWF